VSDERDQFLKRVRRAVAEGNRAGGAPPLPARGSVGHQGAGPDPAARFRDELTAAGGKAHLVADGQEAVAVIVGLVRALSARRALLGGGPVLDELPLAPALTEMGVEVLSVAALEGPAARQAFFAADVGISGVDYLIAETGSLAVRSGPGQPRSLSLLPPVHIAVAHRRQLLPDLFDLFEAEGAGPPACLTLITGPSKTGDIELRLVTGVHGPGEVHVVLIG
jgi:L-lactate utilization protein LutC